MILTCILISGLGIININQHVYFYIQWSNDRINYRFSITKIRNRWFSLKTLINNLDRGSWPGFPQGEGGAKLWRRLLVAKFKISVITSGKFIAAYNSVWWQISRKKWLWRLCHKEPDFKYIKSNKKNRNVKKNTLLLFQNILNKKKHLIFIEKWFLIKFQVLKILFQSKN